MSAPRTVTVQTVNHVTFIITCPSWCVGVHPDGGYLADVTHTGPETPFTFDGEQLLITQLTSHPYAERLPRGLGMYVEWTGDPMTLDPAEIDTLAAALVEHAVQLRDQARHLATLLARGEGQ